MSMLPRDQKIGGIAQPILSGLAASPNVSWATRVIDVRVAEPQWWTIIVGAPRQATYVNPFGSVGIPVQGQQDPDPSFCFIRVSFGTGQIVQVIEVDCGMGGCLPIFASQVQVDVLSTNVILLGSGGQEPGAIPVSISPGFTSRTLPAIRTVNVGIVGPTLTSTPVTAPPFAARVEHQQSATATISRTISFHRRNLATVIEQYTYQISSNRFAPAWPEWTAALPMPYDCSRVSYTNNDAALSVTNLRFLFQLAI